MLSEEERRALNDALAWIAQLRDDAEWRAGMADRDEVAEAGTQAALAAWRKGSIFNSMTPGENYTRPPHEVVMARLTADIIEAVKPLIIAAEHERLRNQILPLLRTSGIRHMPPHTFSDVDKGYDMGLDSVLDMLGWGYGDA